MPPKAEAVSSVASKTRITWEEVGLAAADSHNRTLSSAVLRITPVRDSEVPAHLLEVLAQLVDLGQRQIRAVPLEEVRVDSPLLASVVNRTSLILDLATRILEVVSLGAKIRIRWEVDRYLVRAIMARCLEEQHKIPMPIHLETKM